MKFLKVILVMMIFISGIHSEISKAAKRDEPLNNSGALDSKSSSGDGFLYGKKKSKPIAWVNWNPYSESMNGDSILSARNLYIRFNHFGKIDEKEMGDVYLSFDKEKYDLPKPVIYKTHAEISVPINDYFILELKYKGKIGKLVVEDGKRNILRDFSKEVKVYISPISFDHKCENPIMVVDFHGTIQDTDKCLKNAFKYMEEKNVILVTVSTIGAGVKNQFDSVHLRQENLLVLDSVKSLGNEKTERIEKNILNSNSCVVGFAGDSPEKEGDASLSLNIPYYAVNQKDVTKFKEVKDYDKYCKRRDSYNDYKKRAGDSAACNDEYYYTTSESEYYCERILKVNSNGILESLRAGESKILYSNGVKAARFWRKAYLGYSAEKTCESTGAQLVNGSVNEQVRKVITCKSKLPKRREIDFIEDEKTAFKRGECPLEYELVEDVHTRQVADGLKPSVDVGQYPVGSTYSRDWCEAEEHLRKVLDPPVVEEAESDLEGELDNPEESEDNFSVGDDKGIELENTKDSGKKKRRRKDKK